MMTTIPYHMTTIPRRSLYRLAALYLCLTFAFCGTLQAQNAAALISKGRNAEQMNLTLRATEYYQQAADTDAMAAEPWLCLGLLYEKTGHYSEAISALHHAIALAQGSNEGASSTAAEYMPTDSLLALAHEHLVACYVDDGDFDGAKNGGIADSVELLHLTERAIELNPASANAYASMALIFNHQKQFSAAVTWAKKAIALDSKYPRAYNILGIIYYNQGKDNDAVAQFRKALQADPANDDAFYNLGVLNTLRGNHETALSYLRKGLKSNPKSIKLTYFMGIAYMQRGDSQKAIECNLHIINELDSLYTPAYNRLGSIYCTKGDFDQAIAYHTKASRINPKDAEAFKCLGKVYADKGDYVKAQRNYQKAVLLNDRDHETQLLIAKMYGAQGNASREATAYKKAAKLGNPEAQAWMVKRGKSW